MALFKSRNNKELVKLIKDHFGIISKVAFTYSNSPLECEDLKQEISYQICKSYSSFKHKSKITTWMYQIAINTCMNHIRKYKPVLEELSAKHDRPVDEPQTHPKSQLLKEAINSLKETDKSLIILYLEELPYKQIAEITGLSENLVAVKMLRIKNKLKEELNGK
ncbi:MAG: RNA polymerase subunit sigma-70 [Bacteroidetes bacterium]|nr:MAG: RNA polymerase subunit sigma-70 [Bacteroidota bacterium]